MGLVQAREPRSAILIVRAPAWDLFVKCVSLAGCGRAPYGAVGRLSLRRRHVPSSVAVKDVNRVPGNEPVFLRLPAHGIRHARLDVPSA